MKLPIIILASALLLGGCSRKQREIVTTIPEDRIESGWMSCPEMDVYMKEFSNNHKGDRYWIDAVDGRWENDELQFRLRQSKVPAGWGHMWYWWFNQDESSFQRHLQEMKRQDITLVYRQEFKLPNGEIRFQGVWQRVYGTDGNKRKPFKTPESELDDMLHELDYGWEPADEYHKKYADRLDRSALALCLLGERYGHEGHHQKALEMLQKAVQVDANRTTLKALAKQYLRMGDTEAWLDQMLAILDQTESGRDAIITHQEIADHFVSVGDWDKAWPHIGPSTESNSWLPLMKAAWYYGLTGHSAEGVNCLEQMATGLGNEDIYNYLLSFNFEPTNPIQKKLNQTYQWQANGDPVSLSKAACISLVNQDVEDAAALLTKALKSSNDPWYGVFGAIICDQQEWHKQRDELLQEAVVRFPKLENPSNNRQGLRQFLDLYIKANTEGISPELKVQFKEFSTSYRYEGFNMDAHAFAGEVLRLKGETELATEIFGEAIRPYFQQRVCEFLVYQGLRSMGEDPKLILDAKKAEPEH
jgi:tetratricopeptide (TPR) repeat protein